MSLAAQTREAVRSRPFLFDALRAGVVNYAAAARMLDVSDDTDAVATALRRYAAELPDTDPCDGGDVRITMQSGFEETETEPVFRVGEQGYGIGTGRYTGIQVAGTVPPRAVGNTILLLAVNDIAIEALGMTQRHVLVIVARRDGAPALRFVERAFASSAG